MKISRVKLIIENSDGTRQELSNTMPQEIATKLAIEIIDWKDNYMATVSKIETYQLEESKFINDKPGN